MHEADAWVLNKGNNFLIQEKYCFEDINENEVLIEPIFGSWEGNMGHAIDRSPIDVNISRNEDTIVLGNAGVVRILKIGSSINHLKIGDYAIFLPIPYVNEKPQAWAYDTRGSIGLLSKKSKLPGFLLACIPKNTKYMLSQWAAFSLRYITAWANWKFALAAREARLLGKKEHAPYVWAWGGGVALAELELAKHFCYQTVMLTSKYNRMKYIESLGIDSLDRNEFKNLYYDEEKYKSDREYRKLYVEAEIYFLKKVKEKTNDKGVSIFIDNIGYPVYRATMRSLGRDGVITTCGWKHGMHLQINRAIECFEQHTHIFTHGIQHRSLAEEAIDFAENYGWLPRENQVKNIYNWEDIPQLVQAYSEENLDNYFQLYKIND